MSGTRSGSQSRHLSFGEVLTTINVMEPREDEFYYDAHGIRHKIILSTSDSNHPVMYHVCATTAEDPGYTVQQVEVVCMSSTIEVFETPTSSPADMN
jgi:hypothetical protein